MYWRHPRTTPTVTLFPFTTLFRSIAVSLVLMGLGTFLDRSQSTVGDVSFMKAMITHHSLAITKSERFDVDDYRVCELAVEISESQRREIDEWDWLYEDIQEKGPARTSPSTDSRGVGQECIRRYKS